MKFRELLMDAERDYGKDSQEVAQLRKLMELAPKELLDNVCIEEVEYVG